MVFELVILAVLRFDAFYSACTGSILGSNTTLDTACTSSISGGSTLGTACTSSISGLKTLDTACTSSILGFDTLECCCTWSILGFDTPEYGLYLKYLGILYCSYFEYSQLLSVEQYGPRDRLLLCRGASGSAYQVTHTRCLTDAWKI